MVLTSLFRVPGCILVIEPSPLTVCTVTVPGTMTCVGQKDQSSKVAKMPKTMPKDKVVFRSEVSAADKTPFMKAPHKVR